MTKFQQVLTRTGNNILEDRANLIVRSVEREMKKRYEDLELALLKIEDQLVRLADISPKNKYSLDFEMIDGGSFDDKSIAKWVDDFINLEKKKYSLELEKNVAFKLYNTWFGEQKQENED